MKNWHRPLLVMESTIQLMQIANEKLLNDKMEFDSAKESSESKHV
jgi:hypothetical protein